MAVNWWYNLVARKLNLYCVRLVFENAACKERIKTLEADVVSLSRPSPIREWVETAQVSSAKQRIRQLETELDNMSILRDALRNEQAYTFFLEDCLECKNPSDVFNSLPLEKRKEYFDKVK